MWIADQWKDYEIIDTSKGEKLERWGNYLLVRPDPQVIWDTPKTHKGWKRMNGHYHRSKKGGGEWEFFDLPEQWTIQYKSLTFNLKPFSFKHTGLFPEQAANWDWFSEKIKNAGRPIKVLNLFAYTGGATLAAAAAGAAVTHVDASKGMVAWAKENAVSSGLKDAPIRWLVDDCVKFVEREIRRGNKYDAIIMDPPSYGRGPKGEIWKIEDAIHPLIKLCTQILSDEPHKIMKKKILIITTGGTLACVQNEKGLVPGLSSNDILSYISDITNLYDVDFYELFQLDSANIQPSNWQTMAETIYEKYTSYDGIVIFHGTDTMAYTASALSFMLLNIPIPVVITGSQLSILNPLADAVENCRCAIHMAGSGMPGIFLAFNRKVILGTRASKVRTTSFHAFESINYPYVGEINSRGLDIQRSYIPGPTGSCVLERRLEEKVFLIKLVPGFDGKIFQFLYEQGYRGLIIEAFGMGGIPSLSSEVMNDLRDVIQKGMIVVVKSQCPYEGSNLSLYETGKAALEVGVFEAYDMSTEAVVTKVMWILGKHWERKKIEEMFYKNLAGEINLTSTKE